MSVDASTVFQGLGDYELDVLRALDAEAALDDSRLASAARLSVSTATEAAHKLHALGLVRIDTDNGRERFSLDIEALRQLREQVEATPEAVLS